MLTTILTLLHLLLHCPTISTLHSTFPKFVSELQCNCSCSSSQYPTRFSWQGSWGLYRIVNSEWSTFFVTCSTEKEIGSDWMDQVAGRAFRRNYVALCHLSDVTSVDNLLAWLLVIFKKLDTLSGTYDGEWAAGNSPNLETRKKCWWLVHHSHLRLLICAWKATAINFTSLIWWIPSQFLFQ